MREKRGIYAATRLKKCDICLVEGFSVWSIRVVANGHIYAHPHAPISITFLCAKVIIFYLSLLLISTRRHECGADLRCDQVEKCDVCLIENLVRVNTEHQHAQIGLSAGSAAHTRLWKKINILSFLYRQNWHFFPSISSRQQEPNLYNKKFDENSTCALPSSAYFTIRTYILKQACIHIPTPKHLAYFMTETLWREYFNNKKIFFKN